jgi:peptide/nickel transport system permease protein
MANHVIVPGSALTKGNAERRNSATASSLPGFAFSGNRGGAPAWHVDRQCLYSFTVLGFALPNFAIALILIYIFTIKLAWLPITGIGSSEIATDDWWAYFSPFIVPAITLGIHPIAVLTRVLTSSLIDVLSQDYLRTARAKGLMPSTIIIVHALKNAMIPFVTMAAIQSGHLIGAQVAIEYIFAIPGLGSAMLNAVVNRDFPVVQGVTR